LTIAGSHGNDETADEGSNYIVGMPFQDEAELDLLIELAETETAMQTQDSTPQPQPERKPGVAVPWQEKVKELITTLERDQERRKKK
jgi:hypothetical protein